MKEPKYKGIRKGYDAIFVAWPEDEGVWCGDYIHRMRVQDDRGRWYSR